MKVKKNINRVLALVFSFLICFIAVSCEKIKENDINETYKTNVIRSDIAVYGNFVYCKWDKIYRFNRKTETFSTACMNLECNGSCPLDCIMSYIAGVFDERLYFCSWQQYTHNVYLAYQNIVTGEVTVLKTLSEIEDSGGYLTFVDGEYFYFKCKILKEGSDAKNSSNYDTYICRIPKQGGKDEIVIKCENAETLQMVADDEIITLLDGKLYSTNVGSKDRREIFNFSTNSYTNAATRLSYLDGKIYFLAKSGLTQTSEYSLVNYILSFLVWVDVNTGETGRVVDTPVMSFCLTDETIYYSPFKIRNLYIPDDYKEHPENVKVCLMDETLYACDLNGSDIREVYTNDTLDYAEDFIVVDGILYGWVYDYNKETHTFDDTFFGAINFKSGEIIRTKKP